MPEGRPICSDVDSETYRVSAYIDHFINPLANKHATYVKNSFEFVNKIRNFRVENDWLLVTGDVSSLYTNMHFDRTIDCVKKAFANNPDQKRPDTAILKLLEISLKNNDFKFNGQYYLQVLGTSMGKRFAPGLANLYLLEFDEKATNYSKTKPILFVRYLDDIFFIWPGTIETLKEFESYLNSLIPDIKINFEVNTTEIAFLDVLIYKHEGTLQTKTYFKDTDTHQLLHTHSFHPNHTFEGLIKSQLIRYKRLSSTQNDYNNTCKILFSYLKNRGYNQSKLRKLQNITWHNNTVTTKEAIKSETIPIIVDYCKIGTKLAKTIKNTLNNSDINTANIKFITAYKNGKNLKKLLVRSKLDTRNKPGAFHGCKEPRCQACKHHAPPTDTVHIHSTGLDQYITDNIYCNSRNIVYIITCLKCSQQYIGETSRTLRDRLNDHKSNIKTKKFTPISVHFNQQDHTIKDLKITPIIIIEGHWDRTQKEKYLQNLHKTCYPSGINNTPIDIQNHKF